MTPVAAEPSKSQAPDAAFVEVVPKASNAIKLWLSALAFVLIVLWVQTRNKPGANENLFLSADSTMVGADVVIDGQIAGKLQTSGDNGLGGATYYAHLSNGRHIIDVQKP